jgi:hypothetical protein
VGGFVPAAYRSSDVPRIARTSPTRVASLRGGFATGRWDIADDSAFALGRACLLLREGLVDAAESTDVSNGLDLRGVLPQVCWFASYHPEVADRSFDAVTSLLASCAAAVSRDAKWAMKTTPSSTTIMSDVLNPHNWHILWSPRPEEVFDRSVLSDRVQSTENGADDGGIGGAHAG